MEAKKKLRRRCEYCGTIGEVGTEVFWTVDPYNYDLCGETIMMWLHKDCTEDLAREL